MGMPEITVAVHLMAHLLSLGMSITAIMPTNGAKTSQLNIGNCILQSILYDQVLSLIQIRFGTYDLRSHLISSTPGCSAARYNDQQQHTNDKNGRDHRPDG